MSEIGPLKDKYSLAKCCSPARGDEITGYFSFDDHIKVHRADCTNLQKAEPSRLVSLVWSDILAEANTEPDPAWDSLDETDLAILKHHRDFDIDYSLKVARMLNLDKELVFERHRALRDRGLLERVEALMVQYRKGVADNKWIKHRNHTYYRLTPEGRTCLTYRLDAKA